jgi:hypothetical protein
MFSQKDVDSLESAIRDFSSNIRDVVAQKNASQTKSDGASNTTLVSETGRMVFGEILEKLDKILSGLSLEGRILSAISEKRPDIEGAESRIIGAIPALDGIESLLGENSGNIGRLSKDIKSLSSAFLKFMSNLPEPEKFPEFPDISELNVKLDKLLESPKIIENITDNREKREWNFVVKRGHTGLIENVVAEEI